MAGVKHDEGKARYDLVPRLGIEESAKVFAFGAAKYGDRNWEEGLTFGRLYAAMQRHLAAYWSGEELDPESGLSHLGHAGCCWMMLSELALMDGNDHLDTRGKLHARPEKPSKLDITDLASVGSPHENSPDLPQAPPASGSAGVSVHNCGTVINSQPINLAPAPDYHVASQRARS